MGEMEFRAEIREARETQESERYRMEERDGKESLGMETDADDDGNDFFLFSGIFWIYLGWDGIG